MKNTNLNTFLADARAGDRSAEGKIFEYVRKRFVFLAKRRMGNDDAEDVAHDACMTVMAKYKSLASTDHFEPWTYTILRNHLCNHLRRMKSANSVSDRAVSELHIVQNTSSPDPMVLPELLRCLRKLTRTRPLYARTLNLIHQGYTVPEVCRRLKIRSGYLYVLLNRSRNSLRNCINKGKI